MTVDVSRTHRETVSRIQSPYWRDCVGGKALAFHTADLNQECVLSNARYGPNSLLLKKKGWGWDRGDCTVTGACIAYAWLGFDSQHLT